MKESTNPAQERWEFYPYDHGRLSTPRDAGLPATPAAVRFPDGTEMEVPVPPVLDVEDMEEWRAGRARAIAVADDRGRLIAAAPQLLAAARSALVRLGPTSRVVSEFDAPLVEALRAAIEAAHGRQPQ